MPIRTCSITTFVVKDFLNGLETEHLFPNRLNLISDMTKKDILWERIVSKCHFQSFTYHMISWNSRKIFSQINEAFSITSAKCGKSSLLKYQASPTLSVMKYSANRLEPMLTKMSQMRFSQEWATINICCQLIRESTRRLEKTIKIHYFSSNQVY